MHATMVETANDEESLIGRECIALSYGKVMGRAKDYPYHQGALYRVRRTLAGHLAWRYVRHVGTARRSVRLASEDVKAYAMKHGLPIVDGARHNVRLTARCAVCKRTKILMPGSGVCLACLDMPFDGGVVDDHDDDGVIRG